ncbi:MAG: ribonuclease [Jatrophihabitantaceae bacterium]|nr:ribonuclease [Jatrophihabitantaceae bacterium]
MPIYVACDGSALRNPGPAGWGWYVDEECWAAGGEAHSTNQRMELTAVLEFLRSTAHLPADTEIVMVLDSTYTRDCLTVWVHNWLRNGWQNSKKQPVANRDLIEPAYNLLKVRTGTTFQWVKGHANHPLNTAADKACTGASAAIAAGLPVPTGPGWTIGGPTPAPAPGPAAELSPPTAARPPAYVQDTLGF